MNAMAFDLIIICVALFLSGLVWGYTLGVGSYRKTLVRCSNIGTPEYINGKFYYIVPASNEIPTE